MKFVAVLILVVACIYSTGVLAEAKPGRRFEVAHIRALMRRLAKLEALAPVTVTTVPPGPTTVGPLTPSAALVAAALAQGVSLDTLNSLTPLQLTELQAAFDSGQLSGK